MGIEKHYQQQFYHQKSLFLPMLCSVPSIKDASVPRWKKGQPASSSDDPLSPRIGCMGQVKRNNKIAGFPTSQRLSLSNRSSTTTTTTTTTTSPVVKYFKLKKLFSVKNFGTPTTTTATTISTCGTRQRVTANSSDVSKIHRCKNENHGVINIEEMDPPLPVIKRVPKLQEENQVDSLWKRRSVGPALKSLQLQQIHHPRICVQPPTV